MTDTDHPYSKFCWGNLRSLKDQPEAKGIDVRQQLVEFHARHYRAPAMQLVVLGGQSLDELQEMVVESFSGVASAAAAAASATTAGGGEGTVAEKDGFPGEMMASPSAVVAAAGLPFDSSSLGRAFRVQPVKDIHRLNVTWQLGEQHRYICRRFFRGGALCARRRTPTYVDVGWG